jgi:serine protease SohB
MAFLADLALFAAKTILVVGSVLIILAFIFQMSQKGARNRAQIEIEKLNTRFRSFRRHLQSHLLGKKHFKNILKLEKKADKKDEKADKKSGRIFVLDFDGDIRATAVASLREEVTAILSIAADEDEVVLRLESGGGLVTSYGLAASQLARLKNAKNAKVKLTVCVDKVAASGGYMMACVGDKILAAPFAVLGSIGVIAQIPNFNKLLRKHDIDYREVTAGQYKRTVIGEITEPGLEKFKEQIEGTHVLFKNFVAGHRPRVDLAKVATGEHWYGTQCLELGLIDEVLTSDEYLYNFFQTHDVYRVKFLGRKKWMDRFSEAASLALHKLVLKVFSDLDRSRFEV